MPSNRLTAVWPRSVVKTVKFIPELDIMFLRGEAAFAFLRNEKILDQVEGLVGPELTCSPIQHVRPKLPTGLTPRGRAIRMSCIGTRMRA